MRNFGIQSNINYKFIGDHADFFKKLVHDYSVYEDIDTPLVEGYATKGYEAELILYTASWGKTSAPISFKSDLNDKTILGTLIYEVIESNE